MHSFQARWCLILIVVVSLEFSNAFVRVPSPAKFSTGFGRNNDRNQRLNRADLHVHHGIPKLFRWLVDLYPVVLESVGEGLSKDGVMQVDNFYLDMNGIIHTCTHSNNDKLIMLNEREMFSRIFAYTDRLYKLVKPTNKMYLAIDGVAPRAKMNQQRSRRFRSSKEREALLADYVAKEGKLPDDESFDSNCITPGTEFMFRLGIAFRRWIDYKMETDPFWQNGAEIVFSGPDVPGEGEHKVMDMFREDKAADPDYSPGKRRHCMYGLDADLIMLSLVTHEPHFVLLREKIQKRKQNNRDSGSFSPEDFELLEISLLRKMLNQHFSKMGQTMDSNAARIEQEYALSDGTGKAIEVERFELERVIDDFVFMCFFVGNDFLPCLPHLDIADGSLSLMMNVYRDIMPSLGGYLTSKADIHLPRVELFLQEIARREPLYFQQRATDEKEPLYAEDGYKELYYRNKFGFGGEGEEFANYDGQEKGGQGLGCTPLGEEGGEFFQGLERAPTYEGNKQLLIRSYLEGISWVLEYYHNGCGSWTWFYPYLYAPLASDLTNLGLLPIQFERGTPFTPLLQLLSVLPPQSAPFLPKSYSNLMIDPTSPLYPYYPEEFGVDANGKKNAWESVVKIPFLNEQILLDSVSEIDHKAVLTQEERMRNVLGKEHRFKPNTNSSALPKKKESAKQALDNM